MKKTSAKVSKLRLVINENLRVQRGSESVKYIDVGNVLTDVTSRQNHAVFARRGCGKTLLLHQSAAKLPENIEAVYLNCEDFKRHSFPNVLIEILDGVFGELEKHLTGWFGRKKRSKDLIQQIRKELRELKASPDQAAQQVRELSRATGDQRAGVTLKSGAAGGSAQTSSGRVREIERQYVRNDDKIRRLDMLLPDLKRKIKEFFDTSTTVSAVFIQIDDFYHLQRADQPFVMDYIHRLCKDVPLFFKVATLRHASTLFADRHGQPTGAQERHDYQPLNIDFTFADFRKTETQNKQILREFGSQAGMTANEVDELFKGEGFRRLVWAGGGVPRDILSLFLEVLDQVQNGDGRIGKEDIRHLSRSNFERRIEELKQDSQIDEQDSLIRGIYALRTFCLARQTNVIFIPEQDLQKNDEFKRTIYRLLDYRILHSAGSALTHKSQPGTFQAFVIDMGCYAHMRTLQGKFSEVDISKTDAKEDMRSAPVIRADQFAGLVGDAPANAEEALLADEQP